MIIVGLTGGIGHGKTTFANLLAKQSKSAMHFESWELIAEVGLALRREHQVHPAADDINGINEWLYALPEIIAGHVHARLDFTDVQLTQDRLRANPEHFAKLIEYLELIAAQPELADCDITDDNKDTFRPLLQWLGGYLVVQVGAGVWYDEIVRRIAHLRNSGFELVSIGGLRYPADAERIRNAGGMIIQIDRPTLPEQDRNDLTERERSDIIADAVITNNASLDQLSDCAVTVYSDLCLRQLRPSYTAA